MASYGATSPIYPPTAVEDWMHCPTYRGLRRTWGLEASEWDPARLLGTSVGQGLTAHWRQIRSGVAVDTPEYWAAIAEAAYTPLRAEFQDGGDLTLEGAEKLVSRGLQVALGADLTQGAQVLMVDESTGVCRPDLVLRRDGLRVWDVKTTRSLDARYVGDRLTGYDTLWQLYHETWETQEHYGERVVEAGIMLVVLSPKAQVYLHPVQMDPEHLAQWLQTAEQVWHDMHQEQMGNRAVIQRYTACERRRFGRGPCEYKPACHTLYLDPEKMARVYVRLGAS